MWIRRIASLLVAAGCSLGIATAQPATPSSRLAWDEVGQSVATAQAAAYAVYVDTGTPVALAGVTCVVGTPASTTTCSAAFPALTPGAHTLTLTQIIGGAESAKSATLAFSYVLVVTPTAVRVVP